MKFSGKMCLKIILKVTKSQGFTLSLEDTFFEKPQRVGGGSNWLSPPPSRFRVDHKSIIWRDNLINDMRNNTLIIIRIID